MSSEPPASSSGATKPPEVPSIGTIQFRSFTLPRPGNEEEGSQPLNNAPGREVTPPVLPSIIIEYPRHHWSLASNCVHHCRTVEGFICVLRWRTRQPIGVATATTTVGIGPIASVPLIVRLNPTDCRGYRLIVTVSSSSQDDVLTSGNPQGHPSPGCDECCAAVSSTFNRLPTVTESRALMSALGFLALTVGPSMGLLGQIFVAGNNAMEEESNSTSNWAIGTHHEMSLIHGHVVFRGPPSCNRFQIVPASSTETAAEEGHQVLAGPTFPLPILGAASAAGAEFQLRGPKVAWPTQPPADDKPFTGTGSLLSQTAAVFRDWLIHCPDLGSLAESYGLSVEL